MNLEIAGREALATTHMSLAQETDGLASLHRSWVQHVQAWELAHAAVEANAQSMLARMDALIARLEAR
jgi:hypothetical protein